VLFHKHRISIILIFFVVFLFVIVFITDYDLARTIPIVLSGSGLALSFYFAIMKEKRIGCTSECILGEIFAEFFFYATLYHRVKKLDEQLAESFRNKASDLGKQLKIATINYRRIHSNIEFRDPSNTLENYTDIFDTDEKIPIKIMNLYINTLSILGEKAKQLFVISFTYNLMYLCLKFPEITKEISESIISILSLVGSSKKIRTC